MIHKKISLYLASGYLIIRDQQEEIPYEDISGKERIKIF